MPTSFVLNGKATTLEADPNMPLLWAIREVAGLPGTKFGCGMALCGACSVHLDGQVDPLVRDATGERCRARGEDHRGIAEPGRQGRAGGVDRASSATMRLLPVGTDHVRDGAA